MLTGGSIQRMVNNDTGLKPKLQVLDVKKIVTGKAGERFRLVLSDGQYYMQGMLATQCTALVNTNDLKKFTVIQLNEYVCNNISGKKICVVINCNVVQQMNAGIGKPKNVANPNQSSNNPSASSPNRSNQNRPPPPQNQQAFGQRNNFNQNNQNNNFNNNNNNNNWNNNNNNNNNNRNNNRYNNNNRNNNNNRGNNMNNNSNYSNSMDNIQPVSSLNPYQNSWKIKVRCTNKDNMRHYHNQKGDGKLFGVDLLDKNGTEIRAVAFNEAAEKFFTVFEKNRVYLISKGQVRLARKGFSHIKNDYSITLNTDAEVMPVNADVNEIEHQKYKFIKIAQIENIEAKQFVDVIGVIIDVGPIATIMSNRTQQEIKRRNIKIADETAKIDVTLWSKDAEDFNEDRLRDNKNPIIALKGCKVSTYGGRSLSASGLIDFHPDIQETRTLLQWVQNLPTSITECGLAEMTTGGGTGVNPNAPRRTFAEVKEMKLGEDINSKKDKSKADFFTCVATITTISHSPDKKPWYEANPDIHSEIAKNAKVVAMGDGQWRCEKNGKMYSHYVPRYILRFCATDFTGNIWLTSFNDVAEKILKKPASEAEKLYNSAPEEYEKMFKDAQFRKYLFKCRAFSDQWEDSTRIRYDCIGVQLADPTVESEKLIEKIQFLQNLKSGHSNNNNNNNNNNSNINNY